jgi:hypothetical protein
MRVVAMLLGFNKKVVPSIVQTGGVEPVVIQQLVLKPAIDTQRGVFFNVLHVAYFPAARVPKDAYARLGMPESQFLSVSLLYRRQVLAVRLHCCLTRELDDPALLPNVQPALTAPTPG